jgi:hypothetical protein
MINGVKKCNNISSRCGWEYLCGSYDLIDSPSTNDNDTTDATDATDTTDTTDTTNDNQNNNKCLIDNSIDQIEYIIVDNHNDNKKIQNKKYLYQPPIYRFVSHNKNTHPVNNNNKFYIKPSRSKCLDNNNNMEHTHYGPIRKNVRRGIKYSRLKNGTRDVLYGSQGIVSMSRNESKNQKIYLNDIDIHPTIEYLYDDEKIHDEPNFREYYKHDYNDQKI